MKIGLVVEHFNPHQGDAAQWTHQFANLLLGAGHEVHVVAGCFAKSTDSMPLVRHKIGQVGSQLGFATAAEELLRKLELDVIHDMGSGWHFDLFESHDGSRLAHWQQNLNSMPAWIRPAKRRLMNVLPRYQQIRELSKRQFADPNRLILAMSRMVAGDYLHYHNVRPEQIRLIYNGIDIERFSPDHRHRYRDIFRRRLGVSKEEILLLFVGGDYQRHGLATVIRAMGRLVRTGQPARLVVVGGRQSARYKWMAKRCGAADAVDFIGTISNPVPYYAAADVYVLPTFYDPCSLGVLEAAASGLASVTTRFNGAGEILTQGKDGYLMDNPADDEELDYYLRSLMNRELREQIGHEARRTSLKHTLKKNCDQILAVYREIANCHRRAA